MPFEARIAAGPDVRVVCQQNTALADMLEAALAQGCRGVVSFGTAGGLVDALRPGTWVVARRVLSETECFETDEDWSRALCRALPGASYGDFAGVCAPVTQAAAKRALHEASGALVADMESHIVARLAAQRALPFVVCRVVIDPAERSLPEAALAGLRTDGSTDVWAVLRSLARDPAQLPALLRLAGDAQRARRAMAAGRRRLGRGFAYCRA
ncbi:MAG: phosphorylase [Burkholderiales bacterium]|nr:phosphorylase [Burkholderiales bacterium]MDE2608028.1 phosphorylase [Burkholderiales bacterium]